MQPQALGLIIWGQACLYAGLTAAILLKPAGLASNDGISYFGVHARSVIPYTLGLLGSALLCWLGSRHINTPACKPLKNGLIIFAWLIAVIVATPYAAGPVMNWLHIAAGSALFSLQLLLSIWLVNRLRYKPTALAFMIVELAAGIACAVYLIPTRGFLIQCQIIFQLAFGALLIYSLKKLQPY